MKGNLNKALETFINTNTLYIYISKVKLRGSKRCGNLECGRSGRLL
jgi:hypothetical protein